MENEDLLEKLIKDEVKIYELEKYVSKKEAAEVRKKFIETKTGADLSNLENYSFDPEKVYGRNCENLIGGASMPLGVAGPMMVKADNANGEYFIPLATTEGALIASINRGAKTISMSGGANVVCEYVGITRAPLFRLESIGKAREFKVWFTENYEKIKELAESTDSYLTLKNYKIYTNGKNVWVRINFDTGDAMGMNMAVVATKSMCDYIERNFDGVRTLAISGNMCIDKKPGFINAVEGRGRIVEAEAVIPADVVKRYLKCDVDDVLEVNKNKTIVGSIMAGSLGFNAHTANMLAGIFIATGQDPAQVVGGSLSSTIMEKQGEDLYVHVRIPSLNIATVGGGTGLASQNNCLKMILSNVSDELKEREDINNTDKLAEIIAVAVLAGEISLHAAFAGGSFVKAHEDLGRSKNDGDT